MTEATRRAVTESCVSRAPHRQVEWLAISVGRCGPREICRFGPTGSLLSARRSGKPGLVWSLGDESGAPRGFAQTVDLPSLHEAGPTSTCARERRRAHMPALPFHRALGSWSIRRRRGAVIVSRCCRRVAGRAGRPALEAACGAVYAHAQRQSARIRGGQRETLLIDGHRTARVIRQLLNDQRDWPVSATAAPQPPPVFSRLQRRHAESTNDGQRTMGSL